MCGAIQGVFLGGLAAAPPFLDEMVKVSMGSSARDLVAGGVSDYTLGVSRGTAVASNKSSLIVVVEPADVFL